MRIAALLLFLLFSARAEAADTEDAVLGRAFYLHIPDAAASGGPAVLVLHGGGGNAEQVRVQTGMDAVADRHGFIAVYPEGNAGALLGKMRTWNAGLCCGGAARKDIDDVAFLSAVIDRLVEKYKVDPKRVYATGHSNGAMMSYRLACELSGKIAAIAPNAGTRVFADCRPARAVPVLHIHGTADPCVPYGGGESCGGCFSKAFGISLPGDHWPCRAVEDIVAEHARLNKCGTETEPVFHKGAIDCIRYKDCPATVALCRAEGGGHRWPGTNDGGPPKCKSHPEQKSCRTYLESLGPATLDVDAGELMWSFFKENRLP